MFSLYKKELQSYFYSPFAYVVGALFLFIFAFPFITGISNIDSSQYKFSFPNIFYNNFFYFILLIPILTMRTFAEERKSGTEVLLMSSPLSVFQIVIAKFLAVATLFLTMLLATLFYPVVTMLTGKVVWSSLVCGYVGFYMWGLACIAVGMLMSSFTESPIIAAVLGELAMLLLIFVDNLASSAFIQSIPYVSGVLNWLSTQQRFTVFSQGIFRLGDIIFFITLSVVFLGWTIISINKRRWSRG